MKAPFNQKNQGIISREPVHNGDTTYTEGLVEAIQQGYIADIKPKFTKKYSLLSY